MSETRGTEKRRTLSKSRGLGNRGLGNLLRETPSESGGQQEAPIGSITPSPSQPRRTFDPSQLEELAESIREHGILQPLLVRRQESGGYELIAGERRWRAAGLAGLERVPIVVREDAEDDAEGGAAQERLALALVENVQRSDLNPIELAAAFNDLSEAGWTQERIASAVGKSRASVANLLRLLGLAPKLQALVSAGALSEGHGRALLAASKSQRQSLAERALSNGWSVRQLEEAVRAEPRRRRRRKQEELSPAMQRAVERLESALGTRVEVRRGRIVIHWYDEEQLSALASQIGEAALLSEDGVGDFRI